MQATASGLLEMWRNKVLAREPKTFQEVRTVNGKVMLETSSPAPQQPTTDSGMANLCAMLMTKMTEITDGLKSEVCALRAGHYAQQPTLCRTKYSTGVKERERESFPCKGFGGKSCSVCSKCPGHNAQCNTST